MMYFPATSTSTMMVTTMFRRTTTAAVQRQRQVVQQQQHQIVRHSSFISTMSSSKFDNVTQQQQQQQQQRKPLNNMLVSSSVSFMNTTTYMSTMTSPPSTLNSKKDETTVVADAPKSVSINRMTYHTTSTVHQADAVSVSAPTSTDSTSTSTTSFLNRWIVTAEVAISKIFPGGFGWQSGSLIAANTYGYASDSLNFALCTGIGDAIGVLGGHCLYYSMKKSMLPSSNINMIKEVHTGLWLGCAAFCSGTVWQPIVNTLQMSNCTFTQVMIGTWITCATAFYIGLRAGRTILPLSTLDQPTYTNSQTDIALSISIGGATGFFVGTDTAYLPEQNFLLPIVGITDTTTDLMGCTLAGTSTALGFVTSQSVLNTIYPKQKCWND